MTPEQKKIEQEAAEALNAEFQQFQRSEPYQRALRRERECRDLAFIDGPEIVCKLPMRPLSARDLLLLSNIDCPFLASDFISAKRKPADRPPENITEEWAASHIRIHAAHIAVFLWMQSSEFLPCVGSFWRRFVAKRRRIRFMRRCGKLRYKEACGGIRLYLEDALADSPVSGKGADKAPVASWISSYIFTLASTFGWSEEAILNMPLKRMFQYERRVTQSHNAKALFFNRSDRVRGDFIRMVNERRARERGEHN